jgi:hypothetical protein
MVGFRKSLLTWPAVFFDGGGHLVGFWGLTIAEMPVHQILAQGVSLTPAELLPGMTAKGG